MLFVLLDHGLSTSAQGQKRVMLFPNGFQRNRQGLMKCRWSIGALERCKDARKNAILAKTGYGRIARLLEPPDTERLTMGLRILVGLPR